MTMTDADDSAQGGAQDPQKLSTSPQGDGGGAAGAGGAAVPVSFTAEQQAHIDRVVSERLERERKKQQAAIDKAKADAEAAQAAERGEFQKLYETEKVGRAEAEARLRQMELDQMRRDAAGAAGIPQLWARLQGETAEELATDAKALAAVVAPAPSANGQQRTATTTPTPAPQGGNRLTDEERRQRAAKTF